MRSCTAYESCVTNGGRHDSRGRRGTNRDSRAASCSTADAARFADTGYWYLDRLSAAYDDFIGCRRWAGHRVASPSVLTAAYDVAAAHEVASRTRTRLRRERGSSPDNPYYGRGGSRVHNLVAGGVATGGSGSDRRIRFRYGRKHCRQGRGQRRTEAAGRTCSIGRTAPTPQQSVASVVPNQTDCRAGRVRRHTGYDSEHTDGRCQGGEDCLR